jgi:hypothetical protein
MGRYMAKTMFGNSTIVLGSETDDKLFEALKTVLASYHAEVKESSYNVVALKKLQFGKLKSTLINLKCAQKLMRVYQLKVRLN